MTPDIAALALEIFYSKTTFELLPEDSMGAIRQNTPMGCLKYPNPSVNWFIRKVRMTIHLTPKYWARLKIFATGVYGFENMECVHVVISWCYPHFAAPSTFSNLSDLCVQWERFLETVVGAGVNFRCSGELIFSGCLRERGLFDPGWKVPADVFRDMKNLLKTKITFNESG